MNKIYNPSPNEWDELLKRPTKTVDDIEGIVAEVFKDVKENGDAAIKNYTKRFDKVVLDAVQVSENEIMTEVLRVSQNMQQAIQVASENIFRFHEAQKTKRIEVETYPGVKCWQEKRPIEKVGLYIPGGTAPLFSTILMLAIPAKIAGCKEIVLCTPPDSEGFVHPAILYAAQLCGVTKIFKVGGIQAVAAMTFGTETIPKVYKIFGPGNQYVTVAKQLATKHGVAIDMPAGPSELLVVADDTANPIYVAADLLSQAEHGKDSQVILVSTSKDLIEKVEAEVALQLVNLPRKEIAEVAIDNSKLIYVENDQIALKLINEYGPEHFIVCVKEEDFYVDNIANAGSVFIGNFTPESAGDYASGTNHTLPTNGYAKNYSGVNLDTFMKSMTFQKITEEGLHSLGPVIEMMADAEGLQAHRSAVSLRLIEGNKIK